ncbi:MAG: SPOR domain-containing protein [Bacteroidia bacterium]|nr:SPOR domain-containing protein [Bacteroidia bacterium]
MKFLLRTCLAIFVFALVTPDASAQVSKEETKFWKQKAKMYAGNPLALKAEFENYQEQIKDLKARNKDLLNRSASNQNTDLVDSLRWAAIQVEGELQALQSKYDQLRAEYQSRRKVSDMGIQPGLIYRVQIGAFVFHEMENVKGDSPDIVSEKADGFNKYVIGNFRSYEECEGFRDELKTLGIEDAWIVPYLDGERVSIQEAKDYLARQGKPAFNN